MQIKVIIAAYRDTLNESQPEALYADISTGLPTGRPISTNLNPVHQIIQHR